MQQTDLRVFLCDFRRGKRRKIVVPSLFAGLVELERAAS